MKIRTPAQFAIPCSLEVLCALPNKNSFCQSSQSIWIPVKLLFPWRECVAVRRLRSICDASILLKEMNRRQEIAWNLVFISKGNWTLRFAADDQNFAIRKTTTEGHSHYDSTGHKIEKPSETRTKFGIWHQLESMKPHRGDSPQPSCFHNRQIGWFNQNTTFAQMFPRDKICGWIASSSSAGGSVIEKFTVTPLNEFP